MGVCGVRIRALRFTPGDSPWDRVVRGARWLLRSARKFPAIRFSKEGLWPLSGPHYQQHPDASVLTAMHQRSAAGVLNRCNRGKRGVLAAERRDRCVRYPQSHRRYSRL
jgi:hypothetical protein